MNYNFEYIDIILLAMIAGLIFLRLRAILGRRNGNEDSISGQMTEKSLQKTSIRNLKFYKFDDQAKEQFIKGAKAAYETIITAFGKGNLGEIKLLLDKKVYKDFSEAIKDRNSKKIKSETTFIGIRSAKIKDFSEVNNIYNVTVDFISEIITCSKNSQDQIISGDPEKIKTVSDTWKFSKDKRNSSPIWLLVKTQS